MRIFRLARVDADSVCSSGVFNDYYVVKTQR